MALLVIHRCGAFKLHRVVQTADNDSDDCDEDDDSNTHLAFSPPRGVNHVNPVNPDFQICV
jgi:hypothetical protein